MRSHPNLCSPHSLTLICQLLKELQTEKLKLLKKSLKCSDPVSALKLLKKLGMDIHKVAVSGGLEGL